MSNSFLTMHVIISPFCFLLIFGLTGSLFRVEYLFVFIHFMLFYYCNMTVNMLSICVHKYYSIKLSFHKIACTTYYSQYSNMTVIYFKVVLHFLPMGLCLNSQMSQIVNSLKVSSANCQGLQSKQKRDVISLLKIKIITLFVFRTHT